MASSPCSCCASAAAAALHRSSIEGSAAMSKSPRPSLWRPRTSPCRASTTTQSMASAQSSSSTVTSSRNLLWSWATVTHSGTLRRGNGVPSSGLSSTFSWTTSPSSMASWTSTRGRSVSPSAAHRAKLTESSRLPPEVRTRTSAVTSQAKSPGTTHRARRSTQLSPAHSDSSSRESCRPQSSALQPSVSVTETEGAHSTEIWKCPASGLWCFGLAMSHFTPTISSVSPARSLHELVAEGIGPVSKETRR
mmetsp:Transcript_1938/g.6449  ORF Transcript_1938/g.6449 Transcript_1938/m.6449 type:complete len:249 (+) Transcript_1938:83-829(+)